MSNISAVKKYQEKCDAIMLRPKKKTGAAIRAAAARCGMSVQAWILSQLEPALEQHLAPDLPAEPEEEE